MTTPYPTTTLWTCPFMIPLGMYQSLRSRTAKFDPQRIRQHSVTREARAIPIGEHILVQRTSSRILLLASILHAYLFIKSPQYPSLWPLLVLLLRCSVSIFYLLTLLSRTLITSTLRSLNSSPSLGKYGSCGLLPPPSEFDAALYHYKTHWPLYTKLTLQCSTCHCLCISPAVYTSAGASLAV